MRSLSVRQKLALELARPLHSELAEKHVLRDLFWECTLRCSLRCRHCGSDCHTTASVKDMPFEDFARVLRRISEKYDPHKVFVIVTGGEPLMRPDISSCGRAIYDMGLTDSRPTTTGCAVSQAASKRPRKVSGCSQKWKT